MKLLDGLSIPDKSFAYFNLTVSNNTYSREGDNEAHLAFNVYATSFSSDPDIYISKTEHVARVQEAQWHSTREGSETCIIHKDDYVMGDIFFITIHCMNECTFDLKMSYASDLELEDSERTLFRWGGHSTNILRYKVPNTTSAGLTKKFEILVAPEVDYKYMEVYLSHGKLNTRQFHQNLTIIFNFRQQIQRG